MMCLELLIVVRSEIRPRAPDSRLFRDRMGQHPQMSDTLPAKETSSELVAALYAELRRVAHRERWQHGATPTLQTSALINETYLKLHQANCWNDRQHFLRAAAIAMRQVLVDAARERMTIKRGGGIKPDTLSAADRVAAASDDEVLQVDTALQRLGALDPRLAQIVECRFFAGYSEPETATALHISERTVRRDWTKAKAWLYTEINPT